jgi:putative endopeptidase
MKFTFTLLVLYTLLLASCKRERQLQSGLYLDNIDSTHRAGDNFDGYVNGRWLATHEIPADKSSYGAFELVREKAEKDVYNLIQEAIHTRNQSQADEQISNLFLSYTNVNQRNQDAVKQLNRFFTSIDKINDLKQLASYLALSSQTGIESPIQFYVTTDDKSPDNYIVATRQSGTILRDRTYYLNNDSVSIQLRKKYLQHITNMFTIAGIDTSLHSPKQVLALETSIAQLQMKKEDARNRDLTYNKFNQSELLKLMPHFPLSTYLTKTKFIQQKQFIVGQVDFLKSMDQLFTTTSISNWKTYLKWLTLSSLSPLLSKKTGS